jgi:hypothetical protein
MDRRGLSLAGLDFPGASGMGLVILVAALGGMLGALAVRRQP